MEPACGFVVVAFLALRTWWLMLGLIGVRESNEMAISAAFVNFAPSW